jgi:hypothetical protein
MLPENLRNVWETLKQDTEAMSGTLALELESVWNDLNSVIHRQADVAVEPALKGLEPGRAASIRALVAGPGQQLLFDTIAWLRRIRAQERALAALNDYQASLDGLTSRLPQRIPASPNEWAAVLGIRPPILSRWLGFRSRNRARPRG